MKIVVIYGDDNLASHKRFIHIVSEVKKRGWEIIDMPQGKSLSEMLASGSLFSSERLVIVRNPQKISVKEYTWLSKHYIEYEGRLLLYFPLNIPAVIRKLLPKDSIFEEYKIKKKIFSFLESIYPNQGERLVKQFHKIIETDPPELVLSLLGRQLRDLTWVKNGAEEMNAPSWKLQKLRSQAQKFSWEQISEFVSDLAEADIKSKTGQGEIVTFLDLIFIKL